MPPLTKEQLQQRSEGLGATDIVAVAGLSKYRTPYDVYLEKVQGITEELPPNVEAAAEWGHILEPVIAREFALREGIIFGTMEPGTTVYDDEWGFATPDYIVEPGWLLECKSRSFFAGKAWDNGVPEDVAAQVQWQLRITGATRCTVAVLIGGNDFRTYDIHADPTEQERLYGIARDFWLNHVKAGVPPMHVDTSAEVNIDAAFVDGGLEETELCALLQVLEEDLGLIEERIDHIKTDLQERIGEHAGMNAPGYRILYTPVKGRITVDWQAIAKKLGVTAQMIQEHQKEGKGYRRFKVTPTSSVEV